MNIVKSNIVGCLWIKLWIRVGVDDWTATIASNAQPPNGTSRIEGVWLFHKFPHDICNEQHTNKEVTRYKENTMLECRRKVIFNNFFSLFIW